MEWLLLLVAMIWGGSYSAAKVATEQLPVLPFLALRFGLTFLVLLPALKGLAGRPGWPASLAAAAGLGVNLLAIYVCETFGVSMTTASNAAFLISLCVAFTPLCEWGILGERPTRNVLVAASLSLVGALLLAFQHEGSGMSVGWGDALMVAAAFLRGVMVCLTRRVGLRHGVPALTVTAIQMGVMTLGASALTVAVHGSSLPSLPTGWGFWWAMAYLVLLCTVLAFFVQNRAVASTSPSRVALLTGSEPLWGALIAMVWMGDSMRLQGWVGGGLILLSAWWMTRGKPGEAAPVAIPAT